MATFRPFTDEQARLLVNLRQRYESWMDVERERRIMPYDLRKKAINGQHYLYRITDRGGNGKSLGPWDEEREAEFVAYHSRKAELKERLATSRAQLAESAALYRALRLPLLSSDAGPILRECDRRSLLGSHLLVVGTNAISAYMVEAAGQVLVPDEADRPRPVALPEQEWLLLGRPVDQVVGCRDGSPARIVAPDPRWFALHKLWMSQKPTRNQLKRPKDHKQGMALLDLVAAAMPHYPMGPDFEDALPDELVSCFEEWKAVSSQPNYPDW